MRITFNWGTAVALVYAAFALATLGFVAFAMERRVDLVSPDYYARSLRQDERRAAEVNAAALGASARIEQPSGRAVRVVLPASQSGTARGTITLYRPSDASADRRFELAIDAAGRQDLALPGLAGGHWIVQVQWTAGARHFYLERPVVVR